MTAGGSGRTAAVSGSSSCTTRWPGHARGAQRPRRAVDCAGWQVVVVVVRKVRVEHVDELRRRQHLGRQREACDVLGNADRRAHHVGKYQRASRAAEGPRGAPRGVMSSDMNRFLKLKL